MFDKKLYLILVCAMGVGQAVAMDKDFQDSLWSKFPQTETMYVNLVKDEPLIVDSDYSSKNFKFLSDYVDAYKAKVEENLSSQIAIMNKNVATYASKVRNLENNSEDFKNRAREKIIKFDTGQYNVQKLKMQIKSDYTVIDGALEKWSKTVGYGLLEANKMIIAKAQKTIEKASSEINKKYQEIMAISKSIADEVSLFDAAAQADAAAVAAQKAQQAAAAAEAKAEADKTAKAEADAIAAKALAKRKLLDALRLEAKSRIQQAKLLDGDAQAVVAKITELKSLVNEKIRLIDILSNKIQRNKFDYPADFVSAVSDKVMPSVAREAQAFYEIIRQANHEFNQLAGLEKRLKDKSANVEKQLDIEHQQGQVISELKGILSSVSKLFQRAQEHQEALFNLHSNLVTAERDSLIAQPEIIEKVTEGKDDQAGKEADELTKKEINPQAAERVLELVRAVKIEQDKQRMLSEAARRTRLAKQQEMVARVLDLCRAVQFAK